MGHGGFPLQSAPCLRCTKSTASDAPPPPLRSTADPSLFPPFPRSINSPPRVCYSPPPPSPLSPGHALREWPLRMSLCRFALFGSGSSLFFFSLATVSPIFIIFFHQMGGLDLFVGPHFPMPALSEPDRFLPNPPQGRFSSPRIMCGERGVMGSCQGFLTK